LRSGRPGSKSVPNNQFGNAFVFRNDDGRREERGSEDGTDEDMVPTEENPEKWNEELQKQLQWQEDLRVAEKNQAQRNEGQQFREQEHQAAGIPFATQPLGGFPFAIYQHPVNYYNQFPQQVPTYNWSPGGASTSRVGCKGPGRTGGGSGRHDHQQHCKGVKLIERRSEEDEDDAKAKKGHFKRGKISSKGLLDFDTIQTNIKHCFSFFQILTERSKTAEGAKLGMAMKKVRTQYTITFH